MSGQTMGLPAAPPTGLRALLPVQSPERCPGPGSGSETAQSSAGSWR